MNKGSNVQDDSQFPVFAIKPPASVVLVSIQLQFVYFWKEKDAYNKLPGAVSLKELLKYLNSDIHTDFQSGDSVSVN